MKIMIPVVAAAFLLAACAHDPGYRGDIVAPALPAVVYMESEPYYNHGGYHYHYRNNIWYFSKSRSGPWTELPRDRWPRETRFRVGDARMPPALPSVVYLEADPYYSQEGYYYHYRDNVWYYATSRNGPWTELPRDLYPGETRYRVVGEPRVAPPLPTIVILETDPYFSHEGFFYHYRDNRWYYSTSRNGPWMELPRDRWPKETRFKVIERR